MATQADERRIALSLPETEEAVDRFAFSVRNKGELKGFVWVWMQRIEPKKPRVPQPDVVAIRVASLADKILRGWVLVGRGISGECRRLLRERCDSGRFFAERKATFSLRAGVS
jgi:hypothetical protein